MRQLLIQRSLRAGATAGACSSRIGWCAPTLRQTLRAARCCVITVVPISSEPIQLLPKLDKLSHFPLAARRHELLFDTLASQDETGEVSAHPSLFERRLGLRSAGAASQRSWVVECRISGLLSCLQNSTCFRDFRG